MVHFGPSQGCRTCRERRVKCDEERPGCKRCRRIGKACPGYADRQDRLFRDETARTVGRLGRKNSGSGSSSSPSPPQPSSSSPGLPAGADDQCLRLFVDTHVKLTEHGSLDHFGHVSSLTHMYHLFLNSPPGSALSLAFTWLAYNVVASGDAEVISDLWEMAISTIRQEISDHSKRLSDSLLAAVLSLDCGQLYTSRVKGEISSGLHLRGASALIQERAHLNYKSETAKWLLIAARCNARDYVMITGNFANIDAAIWGWDETKIQMPSSAPIDLDNLTAKYVFLRNRIMDGYPTASNDQHEDNARQVSLLYEETVTWAQRLPHDWSPSASMPLIESHSGWQPRNQWFSSLSIASNLNTWHALRLGIIKLAHDLPSYDPQDLYWGSSVFSAENIRGIFDSICGSLYFIQGRYGPHQQLGARASNQVGLYCCLKNIEFLRTMFDLELEAAPQGAEAPTFGPLRAQVEFLRDMRDSTRRELQALIMTQGA